MSGYVKVQLVMVTAFLLCSCAEPGRGITDSDHVAEDSISLDAPLSSADDTTAAARAEREDFRARIGRQIDRNRLDIEELKNETRKLKKDARAEYEQRITELQGRNELLREQLAAFKGETAEEWTEFRNELLRDLDTLSAGISRLMRSEDKK